MKPNRKTKGKVYLVGAGPGDVGLLTLRGLERLRSADAVVYDSLVNTQTLSLCATSEKVYVGKNPYGTSKKTSQSQQKRINALLVKLARQGKSVVRLKGGDPFVFGRGGEEASYLKRNKVPFEIVPGVTAGVAGPAYMGIPVTDRRLASSVTFVTAHEQSVKSEPSVDWKQIASIQGTLVIFMGVARLSTIARELICYGKSKRTPVSVIANATLKDQRAVHGTLATIAGKVRKKKIMAPAVIVIGEVAKLRRQLPWTPQPSVNESLWGKNVLVTRATSQASHLRDLLESQGAHVLEFPAIKIVPPGNPKKLDRALKSLQDIDWILFTSTNAVEAVWSRVGKLKKDARIFAGVKIAAIGPATAQRLKAFGVSPDLVPKAFTTQSLIRSLKMKKQISGKRFLLPRTDIAPEYLKVELEKQGGVVTQVVAYRTVKGYRSAGLKRLKKRLLENQIDFITFTSSSTVRNFLSAFPEKTRKKLQKKSHFVSIGPVTSATLKHFGLRPSLEAREHSLRGLVSALSSASKK